MLSGQSKVFVRGPRSFYSSPGPAPNLALRKHSAHALSKETTWDIGKWGRSSSEASDLISRGRVGIAAPREVALPTPGSGERQGGSLLPDLIGKYRYKDLSNLLKITEQRNGGPKMGPYLWRSQLVLLTAPPPSCLEPPLPHL